MRRAVITGLGPVTPIGLGDAAYAAAQRTGLSGEITSDAELEVRGRCVAPVRSPLVPHLAQADWREDRAVQLALAAAQLAVQDSGLCAGELAGERSGCIMGSGLGAAGDWCALDGPGHTMFPCAQITGVLGARYGLQGPGGTVVMACASGAGAVGDAFRTIQLGLADIMLTGGADAALHPLIVAAFGAMRALSRRSETASRPFSLGRDGFVLGEGAGVLVLEELEHALKRGARIHAEVVGYGTSADAYHITMPAPEGRGAQVAMRAALKSAAINPEQVGYINAHGTSTPANDLNETRAIQAVYGEHAYRVPVSSTKSMTGHLLGAAGAIEAIAVAQALRDGVLPPTINLEEPDPELGLDYIAEGARGVQAEYAASHSFAFGGQNAVLVFKRWH